MAPVLSRSLTPSSLQSLPYSPLFSSKSNTSTNNTNRLCLLKSGLKSSGLKTCSGLKWKVDKRVGNSVVVRCEASAVAEKETSGETYEYQAEGATIDLKLPRRSLQVHFTCDACGVRSQRLINRLAYEKGLVYVQCSGCSQYHKLVDNLNLMVEYDFREEINVSSDTDQA